MFKVFKNISFLRAKEILPQDTVKKLLSGKGQGFGWYFFLLGIYIVVMNPIRLLDANSEINKFWYAKLVLLSTLLIIVIITIIKLVMIKYHFLRQTSDFISTYILTLCIVISIAAGVMSIIPYGLITGILVFIIGIFINYVFFIIGLKNRGGNLKENGVYRKIESSIWYIFVLLLLFANAFRLLKVFPNTSEAVSNSLGSSGVITSIVISFLAIVIPAMYLEFNAIKFFNGFLLLRFAGEFKKEYKISDNDWRKGVREK